MRILWFINDDVNFSQTLKANVDKVQLQNNIIEFGIPPKSEQHA